MNIKRRTVLKGAAALAAAPVGLLAAQPGGSDLNAGPTATSVGSPSASGRSYDEALHQLAGYAGELRANWGPPGMAVCVVDREGYTGYVRSGWANAERRIPLREDHLFQVGSISKMMAALTLWSIFEEGKLSADTPLAEALPGVEVRDGAGILLQHVLNHNSGMPNNTPVFSEVGLWSSYTPGTQWNYCNVGYGMLGTIIEHADGRPFAEAVTARVLKPLGMHDSVGAILCSQRERYPVGYLPRVMNRLSLRPGGVAPAAWADVDNSAGCIAATVGDMAKFLRFLITLAEGNGAGVLSDTAAKSFMTNPAAAPAWGEGVTYGNGIGHFEVDGRRYLHHTGGMVSFVSSLHVDIAAGVAAFASANIGFQSGYRPRDISLHACKLLHAVQAGIEFPAPESSLPRVDNAQQYAGVFTAADGETLGVVAAGDQLTLRHGGTESRMQDSGDQLFACDAPAFLVTGLKFDLEEGQAVRVWAGAREFVADPSAGYKPPAAAQLAVNAGRYDGILPTRIYARDGALWLNNRTKLVPLENGDWRFGPEWSPERVRFDGFLAGRPHRLMFNGNASVRTTEDSP